jgi:hypothetical protein
MSRQTISTATTTWVPPSTVDRFVAIDKMARTRDGQQGAVRYFIGRCVVLDVGDGKEATVLVSEVQIARERKG